jgi:hypothetical protein
MSYASRNRSIVNEWCETLCVRKHRVENRRYAKLTVETTKHAISSSSVMKGKPEIEIIVYFREGDLRSYRTSIVV